MRIVSANLNQRLGSPTVRARVETWLSIHRVDLLVAQEPFGVGTVVRPPLKGYRLLSTTRLVSCWGLESGAFPRVVDHSDRWQEIFLGNVTIHNVYLPDDSSRKRREFLLKLADQLGQNGQLSTVVLGDFNLAPRLVDGLFGTKPSTFTRTGERLALAQVLHAGCLVDSTCPDDGEQPEFTFERTQQNQASRFRCDLALISHTLRKEVTVHYDHSVRRGTDAFTDHSAIVVDLPETLPCSGQPELVGQEASPQTPVQGETSNKIAPHKTAIKRLRESQIARELNSRGILRLLRVRSLLDFGCGYGEDVRFYVSLGIEADGYDIEPRFGQPRPKDRQYDLVTMVFVVNVLSSQGERLQAIRDASVFVKPGGHLLIAARSESAVARAARRGRWATFNDGFISDSAKHTFQKGISSAEIGWLMGVIGIRIADCPLRLSHDVTWLLGTRAG